MFFRCFPLLFHFFLFCCVLKGSKKKMRKFEQRRFPRMKRSSSENKEKVIYNTPYGVRSHFPSFNTNVRICRHFPSCRFRLISRLDRANTKALKLSGKQKQKGKHYTPNQNTTRGRARGGFERRRNNKFSLPIFWLLLALVAAAVGASTKAKSHTVLHSVLYSLFGKETTKKLNDKNLYDLISF